MHVPIVGLRRFIFSLCIASMCAIGSAAQTETIVHSFTGLSDGGLPESGLVPDGKGNFFGTTHYGGTNFGGVVYELSPNSNGTWTEQVVYNFGLQGTISAANPSGALAIDTTGNIYGVVASGGELNFGAVFEVSPSSNGTWTAKLLHIFGTSSNDGAFPSAEGVVLDAAGNLYGTTNVGGAYSYGTVYELVPSANGIWTEKILYSFHGGNDGGMFAGSAPVLDSVGNLYGVATLYGAKDYGAVYELSPGPGGNWTGKVLYSFPGGTGGAYPTGSLLLDSSGNLYGTTNCTVYELIRGTNGTWTEKTLHTFEGGKDGATSLAGLIFDKAGNLYGTTRDGGSHRGTVFELSPGSNSVWTEKILHRFASNGTDGYNPQIANLALDTTGNVLGTTYVGGVSNVGVVFEIQP